MTDYCRAKAQKDANLGIPTSPDRLLNHIRHEKLNEVVSVKVSTSLKRFLTENEQSVSAFCREAIIEKLLRDYQEGSK